MYSYISSDKPNRKRQPELDLAKFIGLILMVACHCGIYWFEAGTAAYEFFDLLGGEFAAPVFMACMGVGVVFSRHNEPDLLIKRGFGIFITGYVLNFVRATIPEIIFLLVNPEAAMFGIPVSFYMIDILQFAGLALILMGLFKKWKIEPFYQIMIGLLMAGLGDILAWKTTGVEWLDAICGLIWGANGWSFFPLLNWFIYPAAGVYFGEILMHCNDKKELYKRLWPIGLVGVALSYYQIFTNYADYYSNGSSYYFQSITNVVYGLCYPILMFSVCYFITNICEVANARFVRFGSTNLNIIYCISWVVILWITYFIINLGVLSINAVTFTILMIAVFVISFVLCHFWVKYKKSKQTKA